MRKRERIRKFLKKIWREPPLYYAVSVFVGGCLTLLLYLWFGPLWMFRFPLLLGISLAVARFVAGLGLPLIWATGCVYLLKHLSPRFKGKKKKAQYLLTFLNIGAIVIFFVMIGWQSMNLFLGLREVFFPEGGAEQTSLGAPVLNALPMVGILYFQISTYILPTWKSEPRVRKEKGTVNKIEEKLGKISRKIKKGYWKYLRRDLLKAHLEEYVVFRSRFDNLRERIAWLMILPLAIGLSMFPILSLPPIFIWIRIVVLRQTKKEDSRIEKLLLTAFLSLAGIWLFLILTPFFPYSFPGLIRVFLWTLPYMGGTALAFYLFFRSTMWKRLPKIT